MQENSRYAEDGLVEYSAVLRIEYTAKLIVKCFVTRDSGILCKAFCSFVRPVLELSSKIWNPYFKMDI